MEKIYIVGKRSLIAKNLFNFFKNKKKKVSLIDYKDIKITKKKFIIINCSSKKNSKHDPILDRDIKIINKISKTNNSFYYIMLSTAKVYGGKKLIKKETLKCNPNSKYGKYRRKVEILLKQKMKMKNFIILRLTNLLNLDLRQKSNSKTFINKMLRDLRYKNIIEIPKDKTIKDFIDQNSFHKIFDLLIKKKIIGTFNLSSGIPTSTDQIAKYIIKGYEKGSIVKNKSLITDSFVLSSQKLNKYIKFKISKKKLNNEFINIGRNLRNV